ncbi:hypothetical protein GCM10027570_29160 [Streptomonospora sediminis]
MPHAVDPQRVAEHGGAVMRLVDEVFPLVEGFYVDLHKNPELSHQEHRTAGAVAEWLTRAGFEVETGVGGTGVVGVLRNGDGPTVLLRADMDALPVQERTGLPYASTARGRDDSGHDVPIMHACGHDAHTACLVGTADLLAEARGEWRGTLMVVAQPGEETLDGAIAMLRDGLYTRYGRPDVVLAQHLGPQPAGMVAHRAGTIMAASTNLQVRVFGSGGHASRPENTVDPVLIAANIVTRLQTIVAREISPSEMAVVTVGVLRAGTKHNVIPEEAYLEIDTRALNPAVAERLHSAIDRIVRAEAAASGAQREPEITAARETGVTANEPAATAEVVSAHRAYFGDDYIIELPEPITGSEDFPAFGLPGDPAPVPYVYWFLGATPHDVWESAPGETPYEKLMGVPATHSPFFAPDRESTLRAGLTALSLGALTYLGTPESAAPADGRAAPTGGQAAPTGAQTAATGGQAAMHAPTGSGEMQDPYQGPYQQSAPPPVPALSGPGEGGGYPGAYGPQDFGPQDSGSQGEAPAPFAEPGSAPPPAGPPAGPPAAPPAGPPPAGHAAAPPAGQPFGEFPPPAGPVPPTAAYPPGPPAGAPESGGHWDGRSESRPDGQPGPEPAGAPEPDDDEGESTAYTDMDRYLDDADDPAPSYGPAPGYDPAPAFDQEQPGYGPPPAGPPLQGPPAPPPAGPPISAPPPQGPPVSAPPPPPGAVPYSTERDPGTGGHPAQPHDPQGPQGPQGPQDQRNAQHPQDPPDPQYYDPQQPGQPGQDSPADPPPDPPYRL